MLSYFVIMYLTLSIKIYTLYQIHQSEVIPVFYPCLKEYNNYNNKKMKNTTKKMKKTTTKKRQRQRRRPAQHCLHSKKHLQAGRLADKYSSWPENFFLFI